MKAAFLGAAAC